MSSTYLRSETRRSARRRHCDWCWEFIERGEAHEAIIGVVDNCIATSHMHPECATASSKIHPDDSWSPGEFKRGSTEER